MLLLLDNFEHLVQAVPTVAELLAVGPNLKILVTSRSALHIYGEHEFPVPPLALPDSPSALPVENISDVVDQMDLSDLSRVNKTVPLDISSVGAAGAGRVRCA